jgi:hypothetical protein
MSRKTPKPREVPLRRAIKPLKRLPRIVIGSVFDICSLPRDIKEKIKKEILGK